MDVTTKLQKKTKPIYLSVPKLQEVIRLTSERSLSSVKAKYFEGYGIKGTDAVLAVSSLRFLGLLDDTGTPTEKMAKLRLKGEARKKEFESVIRSAYKVLFTVVEKPYELAPDDLNNEMVTHYDLSPRIARAAVPAFLWLCEYAGLIQEGSVSIRQRRSKTGISKKSGVTSSGKKTPQDKYNAQKIEHPKSVSGLTDIVIMEGKLIISISPEIQSRAWLDKDLGEDLRTFVKKGQEFADKHTPKEKPPETVDNS